MDLEDKHHLAVTVPCGRRWNRDPQECAQVVKENPERAPLSFDS